MKMIFRPLAKFAKYRYPFNINLEENAGYLKKVQRAEELMVEFQEQKPVPRRKRRLYDRPKIDRDISSYGVWRVFNSEEWINKPNENSMEVVAKMRIAPKWLVHAIGIGCLAVANKRSSHREFMFQDNQMNRFLLYEFRNTTAFKPNNEGYNYENQEHIKPKQRIIQRLPPAHFWASEKEFEFRINCTINAEHHKFIEWLNKQIQLKKQSEKSYDDLIDEKYGKTITFNHPAEKDLFEPNKAMVTMVTPAHFEEKKKKSKEAEPSQFKCSRKLEESYRLQESEIQSQQLR